VVNYYLITCRKQQEAGWENMLYKIMRGTERVYGDDFLASLVESIADTLQVDYAFVGKLIRENEQEDKIQVLSIWGKGQHLEPFEYKLAGTPCEEIVNKKQKLIQVKVATLYPEDKCLAEMHVESYWGTPIFYSNGQPLGLLVIMDGKPMAHDPVTAYILNIFAGRAGAEIEWQETIEKLHSQDLKLQSVINAIPHPIFYKNKDGRYEGVNKAFLEAVNMSEEEVIGRKTIMYNNPEKPDRYDTELLSKPGQVRYASGQPPKAREERQYMVTKSTILNKDGEIEGIAGAAMDITDLKQAEQIVRANEIKYRTLFSSANDAIFLMNESIFIDCNPKTLEIFACNSREDIIGTSPIDFSPEFQPDGQLSKTKAIEKIKAALAGKPQVFYWKHIKKNGEAFDAEVSLNVFTIDNTKFIQAIVRNISDQMQLMRNNEVQKVRLEEMNKFISASDISFEQQLKKLLKLATHSLGMDVGLIGIIRKNNLVVYDAYSESIKLEKNQVLELSNTYCDITFKENKVVALENIKDSKYREHPCYQLTGMNSYIGVPFWVRGKKYGTISFLSEKYSGSFQPIDLDYVQMLAQWVGAALERSQYEEYLLERDALLETLLREIPIDFSVRDANLNMVFQSDISKEYWGNNEGKPIDYSDVDEKTAEKWKDIFARVLQGEVVKGEDQLLIRGKPYHFYSIASPVKVYDKVTEVIVINLDISRIKETEQKLKEKNEQLVKLNEELDRFVYSASHDLRAPLASLLGLIDLAKREEHNDTTDHYLELMTRSINTMDSFIADITNYSRNLRLQTSFEKIDFDKLFNESFEHVRFMMPGEAKKSISITGKHDFYSDYSRLKMVFNNLISNSIRYKSPNRTPHIKLQVKVSPTEAHIALSDNGIGIEAQYLEKVFEMFFRANDKNTGSGLGLFIVKEIIEKLGGKIGIESTPNKGTTVHIDLSNQAPQT
ncbi:MAG TPA: PAS domain S-box protein, partial [Flammeovirgaceae bacterium]|nr:PAS domain S-box protein [Flammeovirgaceae bacterium]